jgi:hypothetical protein
LLPTTARKPAREGHVREVDRDRVIEDPAHPRWRPTSRWRPFCPRGRDARAK